MVKNESPLEERLLDIKYAIPVYGYIKFLKDVTSDDNEKKT